MGIKIEQVSSREYKLLEDILIGKFLVKKGFISDGASIPKGLWWLIGSPFTGNYTRAALLHDALYASELYERDICDDIFLNEMEKDGVSWWKRNLMYSAVRSFGWTVWSSHNDEDVSRARLFIERF